MMHVDVERGTPQQTLPAVMPLLLCVHDEGLCVVGVVAPCTVSMTTCLGCECV